MTDKTGFTVRIPEDVHEALKRYAEVLGITLNEAANRAIDHYLRDKPDALSVPRVREFVEALMREHAEDS